MGVIQRVELEALLVRASWFLGISRGGFGGVFDKTVVLKKEGGSTRLDKGSLKHLVYFSRFNYMTRGRPPSTYISTLPR
jgi:hypothetical protein